LRRTAFPTGASDSCLGLRNVQPHFTRLDINWCLVLGEMPHSHVNNHLKWSFVGGLLITHFMIYVISFQKQTLISGLTLPHVFKLRLFQSTWFIFVFWRSHFLKHLTTTKNYKILRHKKKPQFSLPFRITMKGILIQFSSISCQASCQLITQRSWTCFFSTIL
jgi:hypothetical protein